MKKTLKELSATFNGMVGKPFDRQAFWDEVQNAQGVTEVCIGPSSMVISGQHEGRIAAFVDSGVLTRVQVG